MNKFYVYILYSPSIDKYYIGFSENPEKRLEQHNSELNSKWTKNGQPWILNKTFEFRTRSEAMKIEKFIKKQKSRQFIEKIIEQGWK